MSFTKRRLLNACAVLSVVLCAATAALWVRSYSVSDMLTYGGERAKYGLQSASGAIVFVSADVPRSFHATEAVSRSSGFDDNAHESFVNWKGLDYARTPVPFTVPRTQSLPDIVYPLASASLVVPLWAIAVMLAIAPFCYFYVAKRNRWL